jgi:protein SCO1
VDFQLVDTANQPVTRADLAGRFVVVNFVFTSCSLSCRGVNHQMAAIQKRVARMPDVQLLSLTVDPRSDTPEALADFGREFGADTNRWRFLTGGKPELYGLIQSSFIAQSPDFVGIIPGGFMHTDRIMLVDPEGNVCASFNGLRADAAELVLDEINRRRQTLKSK